MSKKIPYSIEQCAGGALVPFSGFTLDVAETYAITFSNEGSIPSNVGLSLQPSGYSYMPSVSDPIVYTIASSTGSTDIGSAHLIRLTIYDDQSNVVHTAFQSIECGESCATQTPTPTATVTPTPSLSISNTPTNTPSNTATNTPTPSITATATPTYSSTPSRTPDPSPTCTTTPTQSPSPTSTLTVTPTRTTTPTYSPTNTITPSITPSNTETPLPKKVDFSIGFNKDIYDISCCSDPELLSVALSGQLNTEYTYEFMSLNNNEYITFDNISGSMYLSDSIVSIYTNVIFSSSDTESLVKCRISDGYNILEDMTVIRCNNTTDLQ